MEKTEIQKEHKTDLFKVSVTNVTYTKRAGGNIRTDFGDLTWLEKSILKDGIIEPIEAYRDKENKGKWIAIDGERRLITSLNLIKSGKVKDVVIKIIQIDDRKISDKEIITKMLGKGEGKHYTVLEKADAAKRLLDMGVKEKEVAEIYGKSLQFIYDLKNISELPKEFKKQISEEKISYTELLRILKHTGGDIEKTNSIINEAFDIATKMREAQEKEVLNLFSDVPFEESKTDNKSVKSRLSEEEKGTLNRILNKPKLKIEEPPKIKITAKFVSKAIKKQNSFAELKKAIDKIDKQNLIVKDKAIYDFGKNIVNSKFNEETIINLITT